MDDTTLIRILGSEGVLHSLFVCNTAFQKPKILGSRMIPWVLVIFGPSFRDIESYF